MRCRLQETASVRPNGSPDGCVAFKKQALPCCRAKLRRLDNQYSLLFHHSRGCGSDGGRDVRYMARLGRLVDCCFMCGFPLVLSSTLLGWLAKISLKSGLTTLRRRRNILRCILTSLHRIDEALPCLRKGFAVEEEGVPDPPVLWNCFNPSVEVSSTNSRICAEISSTAGFSYGAKTLGTVSYRL